MKSSFNKKILEKAYEWINDNQKVVMITVVETWGSSPKPIGSKMIVNKNKEFFGSVSGGCIESFIIQESSKIIKKKKLFEIKKFKVSNENAWNVGLSCGGDITVYLEQINSKDKIFHQIIQKRKNKLEFALLKNLSTGENEIFEKGKPLNKNFEKFKDQIDFIYTSKNNGIIKNSNIFVECYNNPIKIIIIGAVHIAQYLTDFAEKFDFEIYIIDPRNYYGTKERFPNVKVINEWPSEAFKKIKTNSNCALIGLTHDPKIDDPALEYALKKNFFYIGALGSEKTHKKRCERLKKTGFTKEKIDAIHGPIGIKLGGKSAPEIALSIIAQLVNEIYKK
ncbi:XdhC family protein [Candidatus Pelagibacter sp.]|jgi:xanthine dehydrogenase accessory factor|nr:XdhC family protein [Candidatus Pelagibacter sp.]